ncbi:MAG TPA: phosphatase PAP2 family protein [Terriglobales bacterium]
METATIVSLGIAVLSLFLFGWIAENVSRQRTQEFDQTVRDAIHQYASPGRTSAMVAISFAGGDGLAIAAFFAFAAFLGFRWRRAALWLLTTILGALVLDLALKYAFHRARPAPYFGDLPHTPSFPSGHALFSFCFYGVVAGLLAGRMRSSRLRILIWTTAVLLVALIGLSRIYLGVHYPSDVLAGYLTASLWVSAMIALDRWRKRRRRCDTDTPTPSLPKRDGSA